MDERDVQFIVDASLKFFPEAQNVYSFGSTAEGQSRKDSDLDIALLLPPESAKKTGSLGFSDL